MALLQLFEQGVAAHRAGNLAQAENLYRQVLRADAGNFPALHMLGFLKAQQGHYEDAIVLLNKAVKQNPDDITARSHHAHALMAAQHFDDALAAYDRVLAARAGNFEAHYNRGVILSQKQRFEEALAALDAAQALQPDTAAVYYNRGVVLVGLERYREAMAGYDRAVALDPIICRPGPTGHGGAQSLRLDPRGTDHACRGRRGRPTLTFLGYTDDKALQLQCAIGTTRALAPRPLPPQWQGEKYRHDRLRLAYVSADFREHAVAFQLAPLIERHDRKRFK